MTAHSAQPAVFVDAHLGDGPLWLADEGALMWIDLFGRRLHRHEPGSGRNTVVDLVRTVGAIAPRRGGGLAAATEDGFAHLDPESGRLDLVHPVIAHDDTLRMNDGKADAAGRFWAGSMAKAQTPGAGVLHRLDADGSVHDVLRGLTIPNGLDWSADGATMYFIDSRRGGVDAYDFDLATGDLGRQRRVVQIPDDTTAPCRMTVPDGMTLDEDGNLWVAIYGAGEVRCWSPDGTLRHTVHVPAATTTSVAFGGSELDILFITTAAIFREGHRHRGPTDGSLFAVRPGVHGRAPFAARL